MKKTHPVFIVILLSLFGLSGCSGDPEDSTSDKTKKIATKPTERILAKWTIDVEATKQGWGDRTPELERRMVDELTMSVEFKVDNVATLHKSGRTGDAYWEIKDSTDNSLEIIAGESKDAKKKVTLKIEFQGEDQLSWRSSESDFDVALILNKDSK